MLNFVDKARGKYAAGNPLRRRATKGKRLVNNPVARKRLVQQVGSSNDLEFLRQSISDRVNTLTSIAPVMAYPGGANIVQLG